MQLLLLTLVCSTPACVFVRSTVCAFWGSALPPFSKDHLVAKLHCFGLQHFGEREGLLAALGSCKSGCPSCFADASERGCQSEARGWGVSLFSARFDRVMVLAVRVCVALRLQLFLRMRFRLLYLCLRAWPPCCRKCRWCCCLSRCVGVGQGPRSPPAFCRAAGHRAPGGKLHVSLCRCSAFALSANASL